MLTVRGIFIVIYLNYSKLFEAHIYPMVPP